VKVDTIVSFIMMGARVEGKEFTLALGKLWYIKPHGS
jgi:hypothetical protein